MDIRKWLNAVSCFVMIALNTLANLIPLGGNTTGDVSAMYDTLFTPAPVTFSIWFIIYAGLLLFVIYQFDVLGQKHYMKQVRNKITTLFIVSCLFNTVWILSWQYRYIGLSLLFIIGLLISLILLVRAIPDMNESDMVQLNLFRIFELYLGWIMVATVANLCTYMRYLGIYGFSCGSELVTMLLLIGSAFAGMYTVKHTKTNMACIGIVWAYIGICVKHISPAGFNGKFLLIPATTLIMLVALIFAALVKINTDHSN